MKRFAIAFAIIAISLSSSAQTQTPSAPGSVQSNPPIEQLLPSLPHSDVAGTPVAAPAPVIVKPTVVETGTIAGEVLTWVTTVFGGLISTVLTGLLVRWLQKANIDLTEAQRDKLQGIIVNGLNLGAAQAQKDLAGKGDVEIKNQAVAFAIDYVKAHGADTLKALGADPNSPKFQQAVRARIETAIADDATPTHPALDPAVPAKVPAQA